MILKAEIVMPRGGGGSGGDGRVLKMMRVVVMQEEEEEEEMRWMGWLQRLLKQKQMQMQKKSFVPVLPDLPVVVGGGVGDIDLLIVVCWVHEVG